MKEVAGGSVGISNPPKQPFRLRTHGTGGTIDVRAPYACACTQPQRHSHPHTHRGQCCRTNICNQQLSRICRNILMRSSPRAARSHPQSRHCCMLCRGPPSCTPGRMAARSRPKAAAPPRDIRSGAVLVHMSVRCRMGQGPGVGQVQDGARSRSGSVAGWGKVQEWVRCRMGKSRSGVRCRMRQGPGVGQV